jgi:hypothetical protein
MKYPCDYNCYMNNAKYSHTQGLFSESPTSTKGIEVIYFYLFFLIEIITLLLRKQIRIQIQSDHSHTLLGRPV